jgi:hypothetical protein
MSTEIRALALPRRETMGGDGRSRSRRWHCRRGCRRRRRSRSMPLRSLGLVFIVSHLTRLPSLDPGALRPEDALAHLALAALTWGLELAAVGPSAQDALCLALAAIDAGLVGALEVVRVGPLLGGGGWVVGVAQIGICRLRRGHGLSSPSRPRACRVMQRMAQEQLSSSASGLG